MKKNFKSLLLSFVLLFSIFQIPAYSQVGLAIDAAKEIWNAVPDETKKEMKDKAVEVGKDMTNKTIDGVKNTLKDIDENIRRPDVCESNIINEFSYSCIVNKQKDTNQAYIEICGKKSLLAVGNYSVPALSDMPNVNIKVTFEMKNKIYSHDLTKRDFKKDGKIHLYWDLDYKDVDSSKPIEVTFNGTVNSNLKKTSSLSIDDSYNSPSSFWGSSRREASEKAYGTVKSKGLFSSWF